MRNFLKTIGFIISTILIFILVSWFANTITQHIITDVKIENFKNKAVLQDDISSSTLKLYKVESNEEKGFMEKGLFMYPGNKCDIIVSRKSVIDVPIARELVTFFAGGHAALITGDYEDYEILSTDETIIEETGMNEGLNISELNDRYYWINGAYDEVIVLRANNITEEQKDEVISNAMSLLGDPYNYTFTFDNTNKSYCSDLVSKCYDKVGINLNKNGFWTTIYDLIVSNECHIAYYHYFKDGIKYIYYVE